jgi:hypothetical protein
MSYFLRAFCTTDELPPLRRVLDWAANEGVVLELHAPVDEQDWREAELRYSRGKEPLVVEASRARREDGLLSDEVAEFEELLVDVEDSPEKQKVLAQLRNSRAVVAVQLLGDDGYDAAGTFLRFFVECCDAMIQVDGEGFYERDRLLVELA